MKNKIEKEEAIKLMQKILEILPEYTREAIGTRNNMKSDSITGFIGFLQWKSNETD